MSVRKPTVMGDNGRLQDLPSGDTLSGATETGQFTAEADSSLLKLAAVYVSASAHVDKAKADATGTAACVGLTTEAISSAASGNIQTNGVVTGTTSEWDAVTGDTGGLDFNELYFVDPTTAGKITKTRPTGAGKLVTIVGLALSDEMLGLRISEPYLLS